MYRPPASSHFLPLDWEVDLEKLNIAIFLYSLQSSAMYNEGRSMFPGGMFTSTVRAG